jgi:MFS family permease
MAENIAIGKLYDAITGDEEGSVCEDLPENACQEAPGNFFVNAANGALTKLGDQLADPSLVLAWFLDAIGASGLLIGWLTPVRRAGALLPQLIVSGQLRRFKKRRWFWMLGGAGFGLALILMVPAVLVLPNSVAGWSVIFLLGVGSVFRGISSVAFKDVLAKTIPQGKRGSLLATRATIGGVLALAAGLVLRTLVKDQGARTPYFILLALAGSLWLVGVSLVFFIKEEPGATSGSRNAFKEAVAGLQFLKSNANFRQFLIARSVLVSVELSMPFYILLARQVSGQGAGELGIFVVASSLARILSSPLWGRLADHGSRKVLIWSSAIAVLSGVLLLGFSRLSGQVGPTIVMALPVLLVGIAIAGVRLGRKTYLVDAAPSEQRPLYIALTNTIAGIIIFIGGSLGLIVDLFSVEVLLVILIIFAVVGIGLSWRLAPVDQFSP